MTKQSILILTRSVILNEMKDLRFFALLRMTAFILLIIASGAKNLFSQTLKETDLYLVRGDSKTFEFNYYGDVTADELLFVVKKDTAVASVRLVQKQNTVAGGSDSEIEATYRAPFTKIKIKFYPVDTEDLLRNKYKFDLTRTDPNDSTDHTHLFIGNLNLQPTIATPGDGSNVPLDGTRFFFVGLDSTTEEPGIPIFRDSDNSMDYLSYEELRDSMGVLDSLENIRKGLSETLDSILTQRAAIDDLSRQTQNWIVANKDSIPEASDCSGYINRLIQQCISEGKVLKTPYDVLYIDSPIMIMKRSGTTYSFFSFEWDGAQNVYGGQKNTRIVPSFNDKPAILIQHGKGVKLSHLEISGKNNISMTYSEMLADTGWVNNGCRDERYSPYGGIVIDPFGDDSTNSGSGNGYPNMGEYYTANYGGSTQCTFDDLTIYGFVVGIMFTPNDYTANDEAMVVSNCKIDNNKVSVAIGQDQSRQIWIKNLMCWGQTRVVFDCYNYGRSIGVAPRVDGTNIAGGVLYLMAISGGHLRDIAHFNDVYAEAIWSLGWFGFVGGGWLGVMQNSVIKFIDPSTTDRAPEFNFWTTCSFEFKNCYLGYYTNKKLSININTTLGSSLRFTNCKFESLPVVGPQRDVHPQFINCNLNYETSAYYGLTTNGYFDHLYYLPSANKSPVSPFSTYRWNGVEYKINCSVYEDVFIGGYLLTMSGVNAVINIDVSDTGKVQVDDILATYVVPTIYAHGPSGQDSTQINSYIGRVESVAGTTIVLNRVPINVRNGTYYIKVMTLKRFHSPTFGDITSGNDTIKNVTSASTYWSVGNRIYGSGIPDGSYVRAVSGTNVVISMNATATNTSVSLYDATYTIETSGTSYPTTGSWRIGDYSKNNNTTELGTGGGKYVIVGWRRITNGSGNILNTDWVEERILTGN